MPVVMRGVYVSVDGCTEKTAGNDNRIPAYLHLGLPQYSYILETDCICLCLIVCEDKLWCVVRMNWMWGVPRDLVRVSRECVRVCLCVCCEKMVLQ